MGISDSYFADNAGFWDVTVVDNTTNTNLTGGGLGQMVSGNCTPWVFTGGINSAFPITDLTGSIAPSSVAVTAGHTFTMTYPFGTASVLGSLYLAGPLGPGTFGPALQSAQTPHLPFPSGN